MDRVEFRIPTTPSGKNRQQITSSGPRCRVCGGFRHHGITASRDAKRAKAAIHDWVATLARREGWLAGSGTVFGDDDIGADLIVHPRSGCTDIAIYSMGPRPKPYAGRRSDLHNVPDVLMDALQGVLFPNDNAVVRMRLDRRID